VKWLWAAILLLASPSVALAQTSADVRTPDGQTLATATFTQARDAVLVQITFPNRTALVGTHAVQIHAGSQCSPSAPPVADLSDLVISPAGVAVYNLSTRPNVTLPMLGDASLLIYAEGGDNPGQVIACGVIQSGSVRSDAVMPIVIGLLGGLLVAGGVVLRRGA
jgi:Cu/Zn superoxide dismutase